MKLGEHVKNLMKYGIKLWYVSLLVLSTEGEVSEMVKILYIVAVVIAALFCPEVLTRWYGVCFLIVGVIVAVSSYANSYICHEKHDIELNHVD